MNQKTIHHVQSQEVMFRETQNCDECFKSRLIFVWNQLCVTAFTGIVRFIVYQITKERMFFSVDCKKTLHHREWKQFLRSHMSRGSLASTSICVTDRALSTRSQNRTERSSGIIIHVDKGHYFSYYPDVCTIYIPSLWWRTFSPK